MTWVMVSGQPVLADKSAYLHWDLSFPAGLPVWCYLLTGLLLHRMTAFQNRMISGQTWPDVMLS